MIRYSHNPRGGLGNRLFQLNFLGQIAYYLGEEFVFYSPQDAQYFEKVVSSKVPLRHRFLNVIDLEVPKNPTELTKMEFLSGLPQGIDFGLSANALGETFFEYCFRDPSEIIVPKLARQESETRIACHFRGGDFQNWNSKAILGTEYYLDAISHLDSVIGETLDVLLITDDSSLHSFNEVKKALGNRAVCRPNRNYFADFKDLMESKYLINSPSTFSIWAGILGRNDAIIHNRDWVNSQAEVEDPFWQKLKNGGNFFYKASNFI